MSDTGDATLQILIKYIRDEEQAKAALADMEQLKEATKTGGHGVHEAGEEVKFFNTHGREMHRLIHELDHILPGTGLLMRSVFHPDALGIAAVVIGIELIHKAVENYKKKLEEAHEAAVKADFAEGMTAALEATRSATDEQETYIRNLEQIKLGEHGVAAEMNSQLQLLAAIKAARESQASAEKTLALAKLKEDQVFGRITESDEIIRKGDIEKKFIDDKRKAEEANFSAQQKTRDAAIDEAAAKQTGLEHDRDSAKQKLDAANLAKAATKDAPKFEDVVKAQEAADEATKKFEEFTAQGVNDKLPAHTEHYVRAQQEEAQRLQTEANLKSLRFNEAQKASVVDTESLKQDLDAKQKKADENAAALAKARDENNRAGKDAFNPTVVNAKDAAERAQVGSVDSQVRTELFERARKLQEELTKEGPAMSKQDMAELLSLLRSLGTSFYEMGKNHPTTQQLKQEMDSLKRLIESKGK